jgi:hypothetical protein
MCQTDFFYLKMIFVTTFWHKYQNYFLTLHAKLYNYNFAKE